MGCHHNVSMPSAWCVFKMFPYRRHGVSPPCLYAVIMVCHHHAYVVIMVCHRHVSMPSSWCVITISICRQHGVSSPCLYVIIMVCHHHVYVVSIVCHHHVCMAVFIFKCNFSEELTVLEQIALFWMSCLGLFCLVNAWCMIIAIYMLYCMMCDYRLLCYLHYM